MMECKDCIHYQVCQYHITEETKMTVAECSTGFKDKAEFIKLPCKVGTKIYDISELLMPQCYSPEMYIFNADDICISKDSRGFIFTIDGNDYRYEDFGKLVFFSKEEAVDGLEKALKGCERK